MTRRAPVAAALLALAAGVAAQDAPDSGKADLDRLQGRISQLKSRLAESEKKAATLSEELSRLDLKLELATREGELVAATREEFGRRLAAVTAERAAATRSSEHARSALLARARLLHRFGTFGYFRVLLEARDVSAFLDSVERLDALARRDGRLLRQYRESEARLRDDLAREQALKAEVDRLYVRSRQEEKNAAALKSERETLLRRERNESASRRREVSQLTDKAERLERLLDTLSKQSGGDDAVGPSGGIRPWKGVLDWPARGTLLETFGRHKNPKFDTFTNSNGIAVAVPLGTPVRAVYAGRAVYAQWLAEYGNLVILDHGDGMLTLYAWLQGVEVKAGMPVSAGTEIGLAGYGPGRDDSGFYFEVRDRQKASDPIAWLR